MPRETIGSAYVRIIAEGKGFGKTVRKELEKEDPAIVSAMEKMGEGHEEAWSKGFTDQARKDNAPADSILRSLRKGVGKFDAEGKLIAYRFSENFKQSLQKAFGDDIGLALFRDLKRDVNSGKLAIEDLGDEMNDLRPRVARVRVELEKMAAELDHHDRVMPRFNRGWTIFADRVGTFTGRGSRNNFVNFMGSLARNLTLVAGLPLKLAAGFGDLAATFKEAGGGLTGLSKALGGTGSGASIITQLGKLGLAGAVAAAALAALTAFVIGPLIAGLSLALGVITALASTITFALIGALAALATTLLPIIAGFGVLTAAILSLDDAMKKKLTKSIKPLVDEMKKLGDIAAEELFKNAPEQAERLGEIFVGLRPVVRRIARAISDVGDTFIDMMEGRGFKRFLREMKIFLPDAIRSLGTIMANTFGGLGGIFVAAIPLTRRFLGWLERITGQFNNWANSAKGRKELEDFFERAGDSARSLGNFLREVTDLLATVFSGTNTAGNNIFDSMADSVERFNNFLKENPDALADWARDARKFGEAIGNALIGIGKLIDFFDSPQSRKIITGFFKVLPGLIQLSTFGLQLLYEAFSRVIPLIKSVIDAVDRFGDAGTRITRRFGAAWKEMWDRNKERAIEAANAIKNAVERFGDAGIRITRRLGSAFADAGRAAWDLYRDVMSGPAMAMRKLGDLIQDIPGYIRRVAGMTLKIPGVSQTIEGIKQMIGWVETLINAIGRIRWPSPPGAGIIGGLIDKVTARGGIFNGAQARIIAEAGPEAVVPLNRSLSQVDPAVRWLSAIAQGISPPAMASGGVVGGKTIDASGWTIVSPGDPHAVAREAVNQLAAAAYI